jgi:exodeoxyribonuclease VII large subunit
MIYQYKVSELLNNIKIVLTENFPLIYLIGEISDINQNSKSGHLYFNIKEGEFVLSCACWKSVAGKYNIADFLNKTVKIKGKISAYTNSKFYLNALEIELYSEGELLQNLLNLKEKLEKEGVFKANKDKIISKYSNVFGIITSLDGVVIEDIKTTLKTKIPTKVFIYNASMQGEKAVEQIMSGIKYFNSMDIKPNAIIIARGGGSLEDLAVFNNEALVKSVAYSNLPVISAIGHDTDVSLIDLASTQSYATPTASVSFLANKLDLLESIASYKKLIKFNISNLINKIKSQFLLNAKIFKKNSNIQEKYNLYFEKFNNLSKSVILKNITYYNNRFYNFNSNKILLQLNYNYNKLQAYSSKINTNKIIYYKNQLAFFDRLLENLSFKNTLKRGYAVISKNNKPIDNIKNITNSFYTIEMSDGIKKVEIKVNE